MTTKCCEGCGMPGIHQCDCHDSTTMTFHLDSCARVISMEHISQKSAGLLDDCTCPPTKAGENEWERNIRSVVKPSGSTRSGYEVVYDPEALIEQISALLKSQQERYIKKVEGQYLSFKDPSKSGNREMDGWYNHALTDIIRLLRGEEH